MSLLEINRLRIQNLSFQIKQSRNTKLIVFRNDRKDLPHLTISFGNLSKEVDIHLTSRTADEQEAYQSIGKIYEDDIYKMLAEFSLALQKHVFQNITKIKKIRPGWLNRNGYIIAYINEEVESKLLENFAPRQKRHSKWERSLDSLGIGKYIASGEVTKSIFSPSFLHNLADIKYKKPIFAVRAYGKHKPMLIPLALLQRPDGKFCWFSLGKFIANMSDFVKSAIPHHFKQILPKDAWMIIRDQLQLKDLGFE